MGFPETGIGIYPGLGGTQRIAKRAGLGVARYMVFTGDIEQIDTPYLDSKSNGLSYLTDKMIGQEVFAHINLVKGERSFLAELASNLL